MLDTATSTGASGRTISRRATLKHLGWTGPVTVALNLFAVTVLQRLALAVLTPGSFEFSARHIDRVRAGIPPSTPCGRRPQLSHDFSTRGGAVHRAQFLGRARGPMTCSTQRTRGYLRA